MDAAAGRTRLAEGMGRMMDCYQHWMIEQVIVATSSNRECLRVIGDRGEVSSRYGGRL